MRIRREFFVDNYIDYCETWEPKHGVWKTFTMVWEPGLLLATAEALKVGVEYSPIPIPDQWLSRAWPNRSIAVRGATILQALARGVVLARFGGCVDEKEENDARQ